LKLFIEEFYLAQQITIWSNWTRIIPTDESNNGDRITEMRTEFICTIPSLSDQQSLEIKTDKIMFRLCDKEGNNCQERGNFNLII